MAPRRKNFTAKDGIVEAIQLLKRVESYVDGEFTVKHLEAAELWVDRYECLKWAVEVRATVVEMIAWHRAQNRLDLSGTEFALRHDALPMLPADKTAIIR